MAQTKKTDNHYLKDKIRIREENLPAAPVVLDCYAGNGVIWGTIQQNHPKTPIKRVAIEKERGKGQFHLEGDNTKFLLSLDLSKFNVVDLDAYGVPYMQLKILFDRGYHGLVFVTFIQSFMGRLPSGMLCEVGFSRAMINKAPTLCNHHGWEYFLQFLARRGVTRISYVNHQRKYYGYFTI